MPASDWAAWERKNAILARGEDEVHFVWNDYKQESPFRNEDSIVLMRPVTPTWALSAVGPWITLSRIEARLAWKALITRGYERKK